MKRREKRRHSSQPSAELKDPLFVLQLAVRMDESISQDFLHEPLRFHGNVDEFRRAVAYLTKGNRSKQPKPTSALTPIILSGLIAVQQARQQEAESTNDNKNSNNTTTDDAWEQWPTASELLSCCQYMRQSALDRIARKRRIRKLRILALVAGIALVAGVAYCQTVSGLERNMMELGFVPPSQEEADEFSSGLRPCESMDGAEETACRSAEASLWASFRDYASEHSAKLRDCKRRKCSRDSRNIMRRQLSNIHGRASDVELAQGPYAMHTIATRERLVLKTALSSKSTSFEPWWAPNEDDGRIKKGLQWLGDTTINQLVRKRLRNVMKKGTKSKFRVLDVGCGIGGMLYQLAGAAEDRWSDEAEFPRMEYVGVAISSAEILNARRLVAEHEMDLERIQFQQTSFDSSSLRQLGKFSAAVAIESLSFSPNVSSTLSNLASVLQSGGMFIVVDDVVQSSCLECLNNTQESVVEAYSSLGARPSLLTHTEWMNAFDQAGFEVTEAMDIGLHYSLPQLVADGISKSRRTSFRDWILRAVRSKQPSVFLTFLEKWRAWAQRQDISMEPGAEVDIHKRARLQAIQLMQNNIKFIRSKVFRKEGHERLDLTYNMYVCTKR